jgi:ATP-dependent DNA ligase
MLARSGQLPTRGDWAYEVKWDGFRAIVSTEGGLCVRSMRGWDMTDLLPELADLPVKATLDCELVASAPTGHRTSRWCASGCLCAAPRYR